MKWGGDGDPGNFAVGDKDYDPGSRINITGSATIAPSWAGGYNLTVLTQGNIFGFGDPLFEIYRGTWQGGIVLFDKKIPQFCLSA